MGGKCYLTASERSPITYEPAKGMSTLEISKIIGIYHHHPKIIAALTNVSKRSDRD